MTRPAASISAEIPVAAVVIGFTAVPLSLQPFDVGDFAGLFSVGSASDVITNILGFVPLGIVLAWRGPWTAIALAAALSCGAEAAQFFSPFRSPSFADVASNVAGAALGVGGAMFWRRPRMVVAITPLRALIAAALAVAGVAAGAALAPRALQRTMDQIIYMPRTALGLVSSNTRGLDAPGRLEAHWDFNQDGDRISDTSGNGIEVSTVESPVFGPGVEGEALEIERGQYAVANASPAAQMAGSMSVSAWIRTAPDLEGNAAIVSTMSHFERGFEFYVTHDQDWRTVAIQLGALNGATATRYGLTELQPNRWYFVAATYDAPAGAIHVFVDGRPDDACLLGRAAHRQVVSGVPVHLGRHGEDEIDFFHGAIDDVQLASRALSPTEIAALYAALRPQGAASAPPQHAMPTECPSPPAQDPTSMGWLVMFGQLIALVLLGLRSVRMNRVAGFALGGIVGLMVLPAILFNELLPMPILALLLALAGGASIFVAVQPAPTRT